LTDTDTFGGNSKKALQDFIERIERLDEEKATLSQGIKDILAQAKSQGFDTKIMRKVISLRKIDADERRDQEAVLATYMQALGMIQGDLFAQP